jgi:hypothetical protein
MLPPLADATAEVMQFQNTGMDVVEPVAAGTGSKPLMFPEFRGDVIFDFRLRVGV